MGILLRNEERNFIKQYMIDTERTIEDQYMMKSTMVAPSRDSIKLKRCNLRKEIYKIIDNNFVLDDKFIKFLKNGS